jgi:hypothetical protein
MWRCGEDESELTPVFNFSMDQILLEKGSLKDFTAEISTLVEEKINPET